jgi:hypothetical protein
MISYWKQNWINIVLISLFIGSLIFLVIRIVNASKNSCTVTDTYELGDWSQCQPSGIQTRIVNKKDTDIDCKYPEKIEQPENIRTCEYIPTCTLNDWEIAEDWSLCENGKQTRKILNKNKCIISEQDETSGTFSETRTCNIDGKSTTLLIDYTTQIDTSTTGNEYRSNNNNIKIETVGKFKSAKLIISVKTTILNGNLIKIPEYYYLMFALNDKIPRALETSRVAKNRLSFDGKGIFKGTDTPLTLEFDLSEVALAKSSSEGIGILSTKNYLETLNGTDVKKILDMTLYIADGKSMIEQSVQDRIFGTISNAYIEYVCEINSICEIKKI